MGRYIRGAIDEDLGLTTLASKTLVAVAFDEAVSQRMLVSSIVVRLSMNNWTPGAGVGPFLVGISHSDYTAAEVEAVLEAVASWDEGDKLAQEVSNRLVRRMGTLGEGINAASEVSVLNEGVALKFKLNWILNDGDTLDLWAYNLGTAAVSTTVPVVHCVGHANLWPR